MFAEAGKLGTLQIQLVYFRGLDECPRIALDQ
jgi:hypothetical protein